jgi:hypothetical protein
MVQQFGIKPLRKLQESGWENKGIKTVRLKIGW